MVVIFIFLAMLVIAFLLMICLTLFRIEKVTKTTLLITERKIVRNFGRR